jgi:acyl-CoA thioester hydrolase
MEFSFIFQNSQEIIMHSINITPRLYETDALGHINNTVTAGWFETGWVSIFKIFSPQIDFKHLPLMLVRTEIDFVAPMYYGQDVTIKTGIELVGHSSFVIIQEAWQNEVLVTIGKAVHVYFDSNTRKSDRIPDHQRLQLEALIQN